MDLLPSKISRTQFNQVLSRYKDTISTLSRPESPSLSTLDSWRVCELTSSITARETPYMTKDELYKLMQCKLKRGKSRPILHLINNNLNSTVIAATQSAFAEMNKPDVSAALKNALKLSGVGPATASYVLAAYAPRKVPVFSDEGFRWVMFNSEEGKGGRGWDRKLKYDEKEFKTYVEAATALGERLDVTIDEVEKVGFVLGKETAMAGKGPGKTDPATGASKMGLNTSKKRKPGGLAELHSSSTEMKETVKKLRRTGVTKNQPQTQKHDTGAGASIASSGRNLRVRKLMQ